MSVVSNFVGMMKPFFETPSGEKYVQKVISGEKNVIIDLDEVKAWDQNQSIVVINDAVKYGIESIEKALKEAVHVNSPSTDTSELEIGFTGDCIPFMKIRKIPTTSIGKLIKVRGLVNRTHIVKPWAMSIVFKCRECGKHTVPIQQVSLYMMTMPPRKCRACDERTTYDEVDELSDYIDSQEFSIQETHEDISGRIPQRMKMMIFKKYLVNTVYCGDLVEIFGVVRVMPSYIKNKQSRSGNFYMEIHGINKQNKNPEDMEISVEDEQKIIELSQKPNIYNELIDNIAPSLEGMEKCKEACLLTLFGGVAKHRPDITTRGNIHVLFVGDPSTGKSKLLRAVSELAPRGMFSTGRGVTGVGLTAALNKADSGEWVIDAGVLVLADKGIACIDEFDKMRPEDRDNIHETMADQQVSINKAGVNVTLPANTAVIAAANPLVGRFDESRSVFENLKKFPPALFSRFDLIFTLIDKPNIEFDKKVIKRISTTNMTEFTIDRDLFTKYIAYAKRLSPVISKEVTTKINEYFLSTRKAMMEEMNQDTNPVYYRQYEALIRLCEARARILLKQETNIEDAEAAIRIFNIFLNDIDFDTQTKEGGKTKVGESMAKMYDIIKFFQQQPRYVGGVPFKKLIEEGTSRGLTAEMAERAIKQLVLDIRIISPSMNNCYVVTKM